MSPPGSSYAEQARDEIGNRGVATITTATELAGILYALRDDYEAGYVTSVVELVHADVFGDFMEMAAELLDKKYKDAAAVICGSVLEEHLRQLAVKFAVPTTRPDGYSRSAAELNDYLVKAGAYNKIEQKSGRTAQEESTDVEGPLADSGSTPLKIPVVRFYCAECAEREFGEA